MLLAEVIPDSLTCSGYISLSFFFHFIYFSFLCWDLHLEVGFNKPPSVPTVSACSTPGIVGVSGFDVAALSERLVDRVDISILSPCF